MVAAAVWCAAGTITVAMPDAAARRFALPAPWWVLLVAAAVASFVPAWRRRPVLAAPALLSTLPWWPVPLPAIAMIWTGPLAWVPVLAAVGCALGSGPIVALGGVMPRRGRQSTVLAAAATLVVSAAVAWNVSPRVPEGDEPHYLMIAQSLLADHDLRIENNHRQRDYAAFYHGDLAPDYLKRGRDGEIYSIHAPGLPVLVLPAFALFGYRGAEVWLLLLAAATGGAGLAPGLARDGGPDGGVVCLGRDRRLANVPAAQLRLVSGRPRGGGGGRVPARHSVARPRA